MTPLSFFLKNDLEAIPSNDYQSSGLETNPTNNIENKESKYSEELSGSLPDLEVQTDLMTGQVSEVVIIKDTARKWFKLSVPQDSQYLVEYMFVSTDMTDNIDDISGGNYLSVVYSGEPSTVDYIPVIHVYKQFQE